MSLFLIKKIESAVAQENKVYSSTFQLKYLKSFTDDEGEMKTNIVTVDTISFPAYEIIPLIEKSKLIISIVYFY